MTRAALHDVSLAALVCAAPALAHRLSPAFFGLTETAPNSFDVQWKVSISGGLAAVLEPQVPDGCSLTESVRTYVVEDMRLQHGAVSCPEGLAGKAFTVNGLAQTQTDVLLRVDYLDGTASNQRLTPDAPTSTIPERPSTFEVVRTYLVLGVEHILLGIDHLLFVLALLLIVNGIGRLVATVTAFTVAHSITLGAATLGLVHVPSAPVEAIIALSILFLASELARRARRRRCGRRGNLTRRFPWLVAFAFGLLHGFGFAGALSEVGVPQHAVPLALAVLQRRRRARPARCSSQPCSASRGSCGSSARARAGDLAARRRLRHRLRRCVLGRRAHDRRFRMIRCDGECEPARNTEFQVEAQATAVLGEAIRDADGVELQEQDLEAVLARGRDAELPLVLEQLGSCRSSTVEPCGLAVVPILEYVRPPVHRAVADAPARGADVELEPCAEAQQRAAVRRRSD